MRESYEDKIMSVFQKRIDGEEDKNQISFWGMDDFQITKFKNLISKIRRNEEKTKFPDFVCDDGFVEVFKITSSVEKKEKSETVKKGSQYILEKKSIIAK